MSFYLGGFDNGGYYVINDTALAVVEGYVDSFAAVVDITFTVADLATVDPTDIAALTVGVSTGADLATTEAADVLAFDGVVVTYGDLAVTEAVDTFAGTSTVILDADFDVDEDPDIGFFDLQGIAAGTLAVTELQDVFFGRAFVGYFFYGEQEIIYVPWESTVMYAGENRNTIRIAAKPAELEELPEERGMKTKKRLRGRVLQ